MKLRPPSYPLITIDPYTSVWSMTDEVADDITRHWTGKPMPLSCTVTVDDKAYRLIGTDDIEKAEQISVEVFAFSTCYTFHAGTVKLVLEFLSPILPNDLLMISRPISYIDVKAESLDGSIHTVTAVLSVSDAFCVENPGYDTIVTGTKTHINGIKSAYMGSIEQPVLGRAGDEILITWGNVYISTDELGSIGVEQFASQPMIFAKQVFNTGEKSNVLFTVAYDDIYSIKYFGKPLKAYWKTVYSSIDDAIVNAFSDYNDVYERCKQWSENLKTEAAALVSEEYAELLILATRQVIAAHKLVVDNDGKILYISKECKSNGCAATLDVTYPSVPIFLLYNTELVKGMLRPIFKLAKSELWPFEFAPHDVGRYPILNGQVYSRGTNPSGQMPIEESANLLIIVAAISAADENAEFAFEYMDILKQYADYLIKQGVEIGDQLCTDDFAGHLEGNCNLAVKSIIGIRAYAYICEKVRIEDASYYKNTAKALAGEWLEKARLTDGTYALSFGKEKTFSIKYNFIWDKVFKTDLFPDQELVQEKQAYMEKMNPYGIPLDCRRDYTKSDWLMWISALYDEKESANKIIHTLWQTYHLSPSRVPMTDWYSSITSIQVGFQNRTVQGGLWMNLLKEKGICQFK